MHVGYQATLLWPIQSFQIRGWRDAEIVFGQCHRSSSLLPWWVCSVQCHYSCFLKGSNWQILLKAFVKGSSDHTARTKNWTELKIEYVTHLAKAAPLFCLTGKVTFSAVVKWSRQWEAFRRSFQHTYLLYYFLGTSRDRPPLWELSGKEA